MRYGFNRRFDHQTMLLASLSNGTYSDHAAKCLRRLLGAQALSGVCLAFIRSDRAFDTHECQARPLDTDLLLDVALFVRNSF